MPIAVLRLGHRHGRDARISTHCGLVARAFGAREIIYTGERDFEMMDSVNNTTQRWGGPFSARHEEGWKFVVKDYRKKKYAIVQLSMYGLPLQKAIGKIRKRQKVLVIIGGEKVPPEVYQESDYNVGVTQQPHSEIAALAVFLHEYFKGGELPKKFRKAQLRIVPQERGKMIKKLSAQA